MVRLVALACSLLTLAGCSARVGTVLFATDDAAPRAGAGDAATEGDATSSDAALPVRPRDAALDSSLRDAGMLADAGPEGVAGRCRIEGAASGFYENFDGTTLSSTWLLAHGVHSFAGSTARGGFVRDNVSLQNGNLILSVRGDRYTGPVRGIDEGGALRADGRRSAAAVVTRDLFASGTYQVQGHLVGPPGVELALWVMADDDRAGGIDLGLPGLTGDAGDAGSLGYAALRLRTRTSRDPGESTVDQLALAQSLDDGQSHIVRFDWYTVNAPTAQFWLDDSPRWTSTSHVPSGTTRRLWIVAWVPDDRTADFETAELRIENAFITPFGNQGDSCAAASFASPGLVTP
ncbi:MAG: hypothetical protein JWN48_6048 [Myxococcaceae bacterium]|nr:hypothetical protein [Myxococcaceae bacterium]